MFARAREKGITRLTVDPDIENEDGVRFWRAVGFEPRSTVADEAGRTPYLLMALDLEASA